MRLVCFKTRFWISSSDNELCAVGCEVAVVLGRSVGKRETEVGDCCDPESWAGVEIAIELNVGTRGANHCPNAGMRAIAAMITPMIVATAANDCSFDIVLLPLNAIPRVPFVPRCVRRYSSRRPHSIRIFHAASTPPPPASTPAVADDSAGRHRVQRRCCGVSRS